MTDPYHEKILERLGEELDWRVFEDCMTDLLRSVYPGLVPVRGGTDSGMDGAIPDLEGDGEAFPLICTTEERVDRNVRKSLRSQRARQRPRKAVVATSQSLTAPMQAKLKALAKDEGFTLDVVERRGVANLLYRSSRWCRDLLGLSGMPSALSTVPEGVGLPIEMEPIGRDADLEWLRTTGGDCLLVGEPGSGKTFLLQRLVREGWGLFLTSGDKAEIANALRDKEPQTVIVDDAHAHSDRIAVLSQLRAEIGAEFAIVATTWRFEEYAIAQKLGLQSSQIRRLEPLTRAEIKEILEQAGVWTREDVLRELIDQSANKPGLAVTLAMLGLQGAWEDVLLGKALARKLLTFFHKWVGRDATEILAGFALGGGAGMAMEDLAEFLPMEMAVMRQKVVALAAGGVLSGAAPGVLAVLPRTLRSVLLGSVFFDGEAARYDYRKLLAKAPSLEEALEALIRARGCGINVHRTDLKEILAELGTDRLWLPRVQRVWRDFAMLGEHESRWTLDHYPGDVTDVAWETLHNVPQETIRRLLTCAERKISALDSLSGWLGSALDRRRLLVREVRRYLRAGGDRQVGVQAARSALSIALRFSESDALDRQRNVRVGLLPKGVLSEMGEIWSDFVESIRESGLESWSPIFLAIEEWIRPRYPVFRDEKYRAEHKEERYAIVRRMLHDLEPLVKGSPGATAGLRRLASRVELDIDLELDPTFELLYPTVEDRESNGTRLDDDLIDLAVSWAAKPASETLERLQFYANEASRIGHGWPRFDLDFCRHLAQRTDTPETWVDEAMARVLPADLVYPFLKRLVEERRKGFETRLDRCLEETTYSGIAVALVLGFDEPPADLSKKAIDKAHAFSQLVRSMSQRGEIPVPTLVQLLSHSSPESALAAATGEWLARPKGSVRIEVRDAWQQAILQAEPGYLGVSEYWLGEILAADSVLAYYWLRQYLNETDPMTYHRKIGVFVRAIGVLSREQRITLLDELQPRGIMTHALAELIQRDTNVYIKLLGIVHLGRELRLAPLQGIPDVAWAELAALALEEGGFLPHEVASAAFGNVVHEGISEAYWRKWEDAFGRLLNDSRDEIRAVASQGIEQARRLREEARADERRRQL